MQTFLGLPKSKPGDVAAGGIAIIGASNATPYQPGTPSHAEQGPAAIRAASQRYADWHEHFDFDVDGQLLNANFGPVVDTGDVACDPATPEHNRSKIEEAVSSVVRAGAIPVVLGGDDSVPIPVISAYRNDGPVWIVQVDAHLDWRHERFGERLGWSSPMRRASEMPWVSGMVQIGLRGVGSASRGDVDDAKAWGARIVTARRIHAAGMEAALGHVPPGANVIISLDLDALDPAFMPGVAAQVPGGLTYWQIIDLFDGLAARRRIVGCAIVELAPQLDVNGVSGVTAARIACNAISAIGQSR